MTAKDIFSFLHDDLKAIAENNLYRCRRIVETPQQTLIGLNGQQVLNFSSNDYLGLANHPEVVKAFKDGVDDYGVGSASAHLICGHKRVHHELEEALAEFTGRPRALLFSTGYMANLAVLSSLLKHGDAVFEDRLNHASLLDGGVYSGARFKRYLHNDMSSLKSALSASDVNQRLIVTDGVFSMDGDLAPLAKLAQLAGQHHATLMVDDAHGLGVLGEQGAGTVAHFNLGQGDVPILMGTLGKSLGTFGAFVAGCEDLIEYLMQKARTYIYTTALPPAVAAASCASLKLLISETWRREKLFTLVEQFRQGAQQLGLQLLDSFTPIQPILIGDSGKAMAVSEALLAQGLLVSAIRPPTVAVGEARLRVTFSAMHQEQDVFKLLDGLERVLL